MKCYLCGGPLNKKVVTKEAPYRYLQSGLRDVYLTGITVNDCPRCKEEFPVIPKVAHLHKLIAQTIIEQPTPLLGDEIRFLRKHMGRPANKFADLLGITPSYLSRVENDPQSKLGPSADKLIRAVAAKCNGKELPQDLLWKTIGEKKAPEESTFKLDRKNWKKTA